MCSSDLDFSDVLIAMNPAALKANAKWMKPGGTIILDIDNFNEKGIKKAGYEEDPIAEEKLEDYNIIKVPITSMTKEAVKDLGLDTKSVLRSKNMFALGMVYWLFNRPLNFTEQFIEEKFGKRPVIVEVNKKVLQAGYYFGETIEAMKPTYIVPPAVIKKGTYRNVNGNTATSWGLLAAAEKAGLNLFIGSYPITPATVILEELAARKDLGVKSFQAEDEIAGICSTIGASFAGHLSVTTTSGPGLALKSEALGLAIITELPIVVVDVQRGGPSTGLPTKTEQSDLMQALWGRNGESPVVVLAASTPVNCFDFAFKAAQIALEHMTPVILLTDGFLANGTQPWRVPSMKDYPEIHPRFVPEGTMNYEPYARDPETLARSWALPGTKGLEHRIGGLEKDFISGSLSYDPQNHQEMTNVREAKVQKVVRDIPNLEVIGAKEGGLLVVGWGGTFGHLRTAVQELQGEGHKIGLAHFNYIKPLPRNVEDVFEKFDKIIVCELNMGQFANYLRMTHQKFTYHQYNKVQGLPFTVVELKQEFTKFIEEK